jgi:hypothetical protein
VSNVTASTRLMREARALKPSRSPYYLNSPGDHQAEQAPGWYMRDEAGNPIYLGAQELGAVRTIDRLKELTTA